MSFDQQNGGWYRPINPNEHTYTEGFGFEPHPPHVIERKLISRYSSALVLALVGYMFMLSFLQNFFNSAIYSLLPYEFYPSLSDIAAQVADILCYMMSLTVPFFIYALSIRIPVSAYLPLKRVSPKLVVGAVLASLAVAAVANYSADAAYMVFSNIGLPFYEPSQVVPSGVAALVLYVINISVVAAIFEEIAFRGVIMQSLRRFGDGFALICSSILFAMVHISPVSIPHAFIMGLIIGYFTLFTGSIHVGMIIHFVYNLFTFIVSQFTTIDYRIGYLLYFASRTVLTLLGIAAIVWLVKNYQNMFSLKNSDTINPWGEKMRCFFGTVPFLLFTITIVVQAVTYLL